MPVDTRHRFLAQHGGCSQLEHPSAIRRKKMQAKSEGSIYDSGNHCDCEQTRGKKTWASLRRHQLTGCGGVVVVISDVSDRVWLIRVMSAQSARLGCLSCFGCDAIPARFVLVVQMQGEGACRGCPRSFCGHVSTWPSATLARGGWTGAAHLCIHVPRVHIVSVPCVCMCVAGVVGARLRPRGLVSSAPCGFVGEKPLERLVVT